MRKTKAAFAERKIRSSKSTLYRYMEDFGNKYIHKLSQFIVTLNSRRNSSIDMRPNTVSKYQYQRLDSFYIQRIPIQNLLWQHESSRE